MKKIIILGGVVIEIDAERELYIADSTIPFLCEGEEPEVNVKVTWEWDSFYYPKTRLIGEDLLQKYYFENNHYYCEAKGGKAPVTSTCYDEDFRHIICAVNEKPFIQPPKSLDKILSLLPMRAIFLHFSTLFLHASQISLGNVGVLFTAPSGTGKTTQAKLWEKYKNAKIICNDRVLTRKKDGKWITYGYPVDGSEPVCSKDIQELGCIVLLEQGKENNIKKLGLAQSMAFLMEQTVFDCWNYQDREKVIELLLNILQDIPVYKLECTPDEESVNKLYNTLIKEGVL